MQIEPQKIRALAGFRSALRRFLAFSEEATRAAGVTAQQYQAMLALKAYAKSEMPISELADELLLKPNSAAQLVDRLVAAGLVERKPSASDKRAVAVALTAAGDVLLMRLVAAHLEQLAKRKKQLADILRQLRQISPSSRLGAAEK
jgi:DNA-binding MarR family transcriptional regulator